MTTPPQILGYAVGASTVTVPAGTDRVYAFVGGNTLSTRSATLNGVNGSLVIYRAHNGGGYNRDLTVLSWTGVTSGDMSFSSNGNGPILVYAKGVEAASASAADDGSSSSIAFEFDPAYEIVLSCIIAYNSTPQCVDGMQDQINSSYSMALATVDIPPTISATGWSSLGNASVEIVTVLSGNPGLSGVWGWAG